MGGDWLFSIKSRHSIVKGFIVRAPRHLQTLAVDTKLDKTRFWVRLTKACLVRRADPVCNHANQTRLGRRDLEWSIRIHIRSACLLLPPPPPQPVTWNRDEQTGWETSLALSKEHKSILRPEVWIWLVLHALSISFRIRMRTEERTRSIGGHCHGFLVNGLTGSACPC